MKKYILLSILIALFTGVFPIVSCRKCDSAACECGAPGAKNFTIVSMDVSTIALPSKELADTTVYYFKDNIAKALYITETKTTHIQPSEIPFSFTPTALACSPVDPVSRQSISAVQIICKSTVAVHPGLTVSNGDTLNELFEISYPNEYTFVSIADFLKTPQSYYSFDQFLFKWKEIPANPVTLIFDLHIKLSNGKVFLFENERLKVK